MYIRSETVVYITHVVIGGGDKGGAIIGKDVSDAIGSSVVVTSTSNKNTHYIKVLF